MRMAKMLMSRIEYLIAEQLVWRRQKREMREKKGRGEPANL
jgi:hypothetical protein